VTTVILMPELRKVGHLLLQLTTKLAASGNRPARRVLKRMGETGFRQTLPYGGGSVSAANIRQSNRSRDRKERIC